jgi:hypothetical protein
LFRAFNLCGFALRERKGSEFLLPGIALLLHRYSHAKGSSVGSGPTLLIGWRQFHVLTALILICSLTAAPDLAGCTRTNARVVMRVPAEFLSPITCFMQAQAYVAGTSFGQDLASDDRIKILCLRSGAVASAP